MRQSDSYARQVEAARLPLAHLDAAARACSSTAAGSAGRAGINLASYWNPGPAPERGQLIPLGKAKIVKPGKDVTLIGYSRSMLDIPVVASKLSAEGVDCEVIDLRTVSPLDMDTLLTSVKKTGRAVIVHEAVRSIGVGAEVSARIHESLFRELKAPVQRVARQDSPVPFAKQLETAFLYSHEDITQAVRQTLR
jgi:acetoin:2,6-dichlorophenolindophenol oxidoreductase subunit beta